MSGRKLLTAVGAGITTVLLVTVAVIELLDTEFSAIIGLPVGAVTGLAVLGGLWTTFEELSLGLRNAASAYAAFGVATLLLLALRYVNIGRDVFAIPVIIGVSSLTAVVVYGVLVLSDRDIL